MNEQTDRPEHATSARPRRAGPVLLIALLAAAIFAAWQVHRAVFDRKPTLQSNASGGWAGPAKESGTSLQERLMPDPLAAEGIEPLIGDPMGIAPPAGASRQSGRRFVKDGKLTEGAIYWVRGSMDELLGYYEESLGRAGLSMIAAPIERPGRRIASFIGDKAVATVDLRNEPTHDKMIRVIVEITVEQPVAKTDRVR